MPPSITEFCHSRECEVQQRLNGYISETAQLPAEELPKVQGYSLIRELGRGGMAVVYLARQDSLNRLVALKLIHTTSRVEDKRRFKREAEAVARLQHPNIVQVYEIGDSQGWPYLALEYVDGPSLERSIRDKLMAPQSAAELIASLASSIHAAHRAGIIHRDLKPANILFTTDGTPKITDFGLAKLIDNASDGATRSGQLLGTPSYVAPEQVVGLGVGGEITTAIDVYALGAVLYELLTGRPPFRASLPVDTLLQVLHSDPIQPSKIRQGIPRDLETICLTCLNKSPAKRYPSAEALAEDLRRFLEGKPVRARPLSTLGRAIRWMRRHRTATALIATVFLAITGVVAGLAWLWREAELRAAVEAKSNQASQHRAAELAVDRYIAMCEQGEVARGMSGLAETASTLPPEGTELEWVIRANLDAWRHLLVAKRHALAHPGEVRALAFAPEGKYLLTACTDGIGRIWNTANGARVGGNLPHTDSVVAVAFHPKSALVATASQDGTARLWEVPSGKPLGQIMAHEGSLTSLAFSPDGRFLLTGSNDKTARLWNAETGESFGSPIKHEAPVLSVCFSPNTIRFMTGSADGIARLWDTEKGTSFGIVAKHRSPVKFVSISPDGSRFATGSETDFIGTAPPKPGDTRGRTINMNHPVTALAYDTTGDYIVVGGGQNENRAGFESYWLPGRDVVTRLYSYEGRVDSLAVAPSARRILLGGNHWRATLLLEPYENARGLRLEHRGDANLVAFSPDFSRIATASKPMEAQREGTVFLWDTPPSTDGLIALPHSEVIGFAPATGNKLLTVGQGRIQAWDLSTSTPMGLGWPSMSKIAAWRDETTAWIVEGNRAVVRQISTGQPTEQNIEIGSPIRLMANASRNHLLALVDEQNNIRLFDGISGTTQGEPIANSQRIDALAVTSDGNAFAAGGNDGSVRFWKRAEGAMDEIILAHKSPIRALAFSPEGRLLAVGCQDKTLHIWNLATQKRLGEAMLLSEVVTHLTWHPESRMLVAVCLDGSARFWDTITGKGVGPALLWKVSTAIFSEDGSQLLVGSPEKGVRSWQVPVPISGHTLELPIWSRRVCGMGY